MLEIKENSMFDEKLDIRLSGLRPKQRVVIRSFLDHGAGKFAAEAHYEADNSGDISLHSQSSLGGSFTGREPMGLFWSQSTILGDEGGPLIMKDTEPLRYKFTVTDEHGTVLDTKIIRRNILHPNVDRIPIQSGRLRGVLFLPKPTDRKLKGVIDLFGSTGGLQVYRGALLASHGYAVMTLAYFNYEDLPEEHTDVDLDYFEEAIHWLCSHPRIDSSKIAMLGLSMGADICLLSAIHFPQVKVVIAINSNAYLDPFYVLKFRGQILRTYPEEPPDLTKAVFTEKGLSYAESKRRVIGTPPDYSIFPLEKCDGNTFFLFVTGQDDQSAPTEYSDILADRLERHEKSNFEKLRLPKAGHLILPPYNPLIDSSYYKPLNVQLSQGGKEPWHSRGQEIFWEKAIRTLNEHLGPPIKLKPLGSTTESKL